MTRVGLCGNKCGSKRTILCCQISLLCLHVEACTDPWYMWTLLIPSQHCPEVDKPATQTAPTPLPCQARSRQIRPGPTAGPARRLGRIPGPKDIVQVGQGHRTDTRLQMAGRPRCTARIAERVASRVPRAGRSRRWAPTRRRRRLRWSSRPRRSRSRFPAEANCIGISCLSDRPRGESSSRLQKRPCSSRARGAAPN